MKRSAFFALFLLVFNAIVSGQVTLIPFNDTWKYLDNGTNQGTAWRNAGFDDANWKSGIGKLGYGTDNISTIVSFGGHSNNKYITTYFRKTVNIADPTAYAFLTAYVRRDDGLVVYVNGTEVYRNNMGTGTIGFDSVATSGASDDGNATLFFNINNALLVAGDNVIAAEVHQQKANSSDLAFDLKLTTPDNTTPYLLSSVRLNPLTEIASSAAVTFRLTFSEPVNGVSRSDFNLTTTGTATGSFASNAVKQADIDGAVYDVSVSSITGSGTLRLNLRATNTGITDLVGNPIPSVAFTSGQVYTIDRVVPTLVRVHRLSPLVENTTAETLTWQLEFSEQVTGVDLTDFILTTLNGTATADLTAASVVPAGASGSLYNFTINNVTGEGVLRLDLNNTPGINDVAGNPVAGTFTSGQTYQVDRVAPTVLSINRQLPLGIVTNATEVIYRIIFSEAISGLDATDLTLVQSGSLSALLTAGAISPVGTQATTYDITVSLPGGAGTLRLDLNNSGTGITDLLGNSVAAGFSTGHEYSIDQVAPLILGIQRQLPEAGATNAASVTFRINFSESVSGFAAEDLSLFTTGTLSGIIGTSAISPVGIDGTVYDITIASIEGQGSMRIDVPDLTGIADAAGNLLTGNFSVGATYDIDRISPQVLSSMRQQPVDATTSASSVTWRVVFSEPIQGLDAGDFVLTTVEGTTTGMLQHITAVDEAATTYDVTAGTISGGGTLRLDLNASVSVEDAFGNELTENFNTGQSYAILDESTPIVLGINRQLPVNELTNAGSVTYRIRFSESVTGVSVSDFTLLTTGTAAGTLEPGAVQSVGYDGTDYDITVAVTAGAGTLRLNLNSSGTDIMDLQGNSILEGYTAGELYEVDLVVPQVASILRQDPATAETSQQQITWRIQFSEAVSGLLAENFELTTVSGNVVGELDAVSVQAVGVQGTEYDVTLNGYSGTGVLRLDLTANLASVIDIAGNALITAFSSGATYTIIDLNPPAVSSIQRAQPAVTAATSLTWLVTFTEAVQGVDASDFQLTNVSGTVSGTIPAGAVNRIGNSGMQYEVTVTGVNGSGELRLDLNSSGTGITDPEQNAIQLGFDAGEAYEVDQEGPTVLSSSRQDPAAETTNGGPLTWRMIFSEPVSGVDVADFLLTPTGLVSGTVQSVTAVDITNTIFDVVVGAVSGSGTLRLDLNATATGIVDALGNTSGTGFSSGATYIIDQLPVVVSINRHLPLEELTAGASVTWRIRFTEPVTGVDAADFGLTVVSGTASGTVYSVTAAGLDGTAYDIVINALAGEGSLRLDLNGSGTAIRDAGGNLIAEGFTTGQLFRIDRIAPVITGILRQEPVAALTNANQVTWRVLFAEPVTGVGADDFSLVIGGSVTGNLASGAVLPAGMDGTTYDVTVTSLNGAGTLRLDVKNSGTSISDPAGNINTGGFVSGESFEIDRVVPVVSAITRFVPLSNGTTDTVVIYRVGFSEPVTGVDATDFQLTITGGLTGAIVSDVVLVEGSGGNIYDVTVSAISGTGTLRLDLKSSGTSIIDIAGNAINGGYTNGQVYTIDQSPYVVSITRQLPLEELTSGTSVTFRVIFSKKVTGVDFSDFLVKPLSGNVRGTLVLLSNETVGVVATNAVKAVGTTGTTYDVTVRALNGSGNFRLDLLSSGTGIKDVALNSIKSGFTDGERYSVLNSGAEGFGSFTEANPLAISSHTGEKPQAKLWTYAGKWWSVLATSTGTKIFRLDGNQWTETLTVTSHGSTKNDCIVVGEVTHILCFRTGNNDSYIISVEYNPSTGKYQLWNKRKTKIPLALGADTETATMAMDGNGRMWVANDGTTDVSVRWSDAPYSVWSAPIVIATGITTDDISAIVSMPGKIGVLWGNQNTQRFAFRTHTNGASPTVWSTDESPASQSAKNIGFGLADDHLNIMCGSDGTLYCAVKTGYEVPGQEKLALLVRRPSGTWDNLYPVTANEGTRAIVLLNEAAGKLRIAYSSHEDGGEILYRESPIANISFGRPFTLVGGDPDRTYNFTTSTHQVCNSEVVIIATDQRVGVDYAVTIIATDAAAPLSTSGKPHSESTVLVTDHAPMESGPVLEAYPNPFAGNTLVRFTLPESGAYRLTIFNAMGVPVRELNAGTGTAGQQKTISFNGNILPPGLYIIRLQSATTTITLKLLRQ